MLTIIVERNKICFVERGVLNSIGGVKMLDWSKSDLIVLPIGLCVMFLISMLLNIMLRNKSQKIKQIPLQIVAVIVFSLEIVKQILNIIQGFDTWALPFHYCSLFVFFFPLAQLCGEKLKRIAKPVAFASALTVFCGIYLTPGSILGEATADIFGNFWNFHSFFFHYLVCLYVLLSGFLNDYKPKSDDYMKVFVVIFGYCIFGIVLSYLLNTNYNNFLYSVLDFVENLRIIIGQIPYVIGMIIVVTSGTLLSWYIYYLLYKRFSKKN